MILYNRDIFNNCFYYPKRYFWKNFKNVPLYFKRLRHLVKNGYDDLAVWDTFSWFIKVMGDILKRYNEGRVGTPMLTEDFPEILDDMDNEELHNKSEERWNQVIKRMVFLLGEMDEFTCSRENPYDLDEIDKFFEKERELEKYRDSCKDEFFKLFSKYFYYLWD